MRPPNDLGSDDEGPQEEHFLRSTVGGKVVLTGEGADEMLCGYNIFREAKVRRFWSREPQAEARPERTQIAAAAGAPRTVAQGPHPPPAQSRQPRRRLQRNKRWSACSGRWS